MIWYGIGRFMIEAIRGDSLFVGGGTSKISQIVSILFIVAGTGLLIYNIVKKRKTDGKEI